MVALALVLSPVVALLRWFVLYKLWAWFAVTGGAPELAFWQVVGLSLMLSVARDSSALIQYDIWVKVVPDQDERITSRVTNYAFQVAFYLFVLGVGALLA